MREHAIRRIGKALLAAGIGNFLAVVGSEEKVKRLLPDYAAALETVYTVLLVTGFVLLGVGLLLLLLPVETIGDIWQWLMRLLGRDDKPYIPRIARKDDLPTIHAIAEDRIGEVSELRTMERWLDINYRIFWVITERTEKDGREGEEIVGYYCVIPLNQAGTELVENESIDGTQFTEAHIIHNKRGKFRKRPASIYIGGVAATNDDRQVTFEVMGALKHHIMSELDKGVNIAYTRPTTKHGLKYMKKKYGFKPVNRYVKHNQLDHIYKTDLRVIAHK